MPARAAAARWVAAFACATVLPVFAAGAAVAQPTSSSPPSSSSPASSTSSAPPEVSVGATPPPLPPDVGPPEDKQQPDRDYTKSKNCVQSLPSPNTLAVKPWGQDVLRFPELSRFATGKGQKVAVIDTGVANHDFFGGRLTAGGDYVAKDGNGLEDCDGHGTEVAGIIAAKPPADQGIGFRGIAPDAEIVSIRQTSGSYEFKDTTTNQTFGAGNLTTLAMSIVHAANIDGVRVINISINNCRAADGTINETEQKLQAALRYAVEQKDIVVVASAGNFPEDTCSEQNGPDPQNPTRLVFPCWFSEYVMCVGAMEKSGELADFSIEGPWVAVAAPGTEIISLDPGNTQALANQTFDDKGKASPIQGTSFAAPYVAGLAALVREHFKNLTAKQVMYRIKTTAAHPAATGGRDNRVGYGMINPVAALTAFLPAEKNIPADKAVAVPFEMPAPATRDWTPLTVAMIGTGGGLGLLLLTLFVVRTARRNRAGER
jgi:membrane-anchored mycosin MYCP